MNNFVFSFFFILYSYIVKVKIFIFSIFKNYIKLLIEINKFYFINSFVIII